MNQTHAGEFDSRLWDESCGSQDSPLDSTGWKSGRAHKHIITQGDMHLKCVFSFRERELMIGSKASGELTVSISTSGEEDILLLLSI